MDTFASATTAELLARFGIDVLSLLVLIGLLYRRRQSAPAMPLVYAALNVGLFVALTAISAGSFKAGIGFGLFGLLSLVRLRSAAFTLKDVAYTFVALVLALVNGLQQRELWLVASLSLVLLIVVWVADDSRSQPATRVMRLTLDHLVLDPASAQRELDDRLSVPILSVVIDDIDFVRETTRVSVRYTVDEATWQWTSQLPEPVTTEAGQS
ncbi:DUF4956 domain-containing protein [Aeromicrobium sp.]|uniref:DUF4956 domain-containing protein n=1 Tax=Aeromicrobium sp. TaxID=1871063 RepID=UPI0019B71E92|nr:DUF4956 domain-containing protein [Aeromicrobium sp.]MBC7631700.1 DUF4956 domain-containing protein [Aeromicrobium sp.]